MPCDKCGKCGKHVGAKRLKVREAKVLRNATSRYTVDSGDALENAFGHGSPDSRIRRYGAFRSGLAEGRAHSEFLEAMALLDRERAAGIVDAEGYSFISDINGIVRELSAHPGNDWVRSELHRQLGSVLARHPSYTAHMTRDSVVYRRLDGATSARVSRPIADHIQRHIDPAPGAIHYVHQGNPLGESIWTASPERNQADMTQEERDTLMRLADWEIPRGDV